MASQRRCPHRVAVVLSGCGVYDGSETQEVSAVLLALARVGAEAVATAPNLAMPVVLNHLSRLPMPGESRNVLVESARLVRGDAHDLTTLDVASLDAAVFVGGYGATRVLCDYATQGRDARVLPSVDAFVRAMHGARRPLGFLCMAPLIAARTLGVHGVELGTGADAGVRDDMASWGARVVGLGARDLSVDRAHRLVCSAAFTATQDLVAVYDGTDRLVRALIELV